MERDIPGQEYLFFYALKQASYYKTFKKVEKKRSKEVEKSIYIFSLFFLIAGKSREKEK